MRNIGEEGDRANQRFVEISKFFPSWLVISKCLCAFSLTLACMHSVYAWMNAVMRTTRLWKCKNKSLDRVTLCNLSSSMLARALFDPKSPVFSLDWLSLRDGKQSQSTLLLLSPPYLFLAREKEPKTTGFET